MIWGTRNLTCLFLLGLLAACAGRAPDPVSDEALSADALRMAGLSPTIQALAARVSGQIDRSVSNERLAATLKELAARPHPAGSPENRRLANYLNGVFISAGLSSRIEEYEVLLPYPREVVVELLRPVAFRASLKEEALAADFDTHAAPDIGAFMAYCADGEVTAPLVYVNYGRQTDFLQLAQLGIDCRNAIGIARSGSVSDASKAFNAETAGLAALIIYSDPADLGYKKGDPYPTGRWQPESAVRRGSVLDLGVHPGDPLTPGAPSLGQTTRLTLDEAASLPRIPVAPLSAQDARPFLEQLTGSAVPDGWQGGLPFTYHLGGQKGLLARLVVRSDWRTRKIWNVIGTLRGSAFPNDWVILGANRDAWVHGAAEAGSGSAVLAEAARVLGAMAREGLRPSRSIMFCSWDAAEYGLLGSTEFVEGNCAALGRSAVLYIDLHAAVSGPAFDVRGSPSLSVLVRGTLAALRGSDGSGSDLLHLVRERHIPAVGGGGDFLPFLHHAGIPILSPASIGPSGVAHTLYDTYGWMKRYGDPGEHHHARMTRVIASLAWRAGTASMVPFDFTALANWMTQSLSRFVLPGEAPEVIALHEALAGFERAALAFREARAQFLSTDPDPFPANGFCAAARQVYRSFVRAPQNAGGPFYRSMLMAPEAQTGSEVIPFPFLSAAVTRGDADARSAAVRELTVALSNSATLLEGLAQRMREAR